MERRVEEALTYEKLSKGIITALEIIEDKRDGYFYKDKEGTSTFVDMSKRKRLANVWKKEDDEETKERMKKHSERVSDLVFSMDINNFSLRDEEETAAWAKRYEEFVKSLDRK